MKASWRKNLTVSLIVLLGTSAFAQENTQVPADCQKAAIRKTYVQFRKDSGWTTDETNNLAYLHDPFHAEQDPADVVTISVESTDIRSWDGYAAYKVTVQPSREGCQASDAVLVGGEGL
jgi:hypothetical protein